MEFMNIQQCEERVMASFNGDAVSEKFNKTGPESPRALNRQIKSIVGGGPEQLIKNQKDSA